MYFMAQSYLQIVINFLWLPEPDKTCHICPPVLNFTTFCENTEIPQKRANSGSKFSIAHKTAVTKHLIVLQQIEQCCIQRQLNYLIITVRLDWFCRSQTDGFAAYSLGRYPIAKGKPVSSRLYLIMHQTIGLTGYIGLSGNRLSDCRDSRRTD